MKGLRSGDAGLLFPHILGTLRSLNQSRHGTVHDSWRRYGDPRHWLLAVFISDIPSSNVLAWLNDGTGHYVALKTTMFADTETPFWLT